MADSVQSIATDPDSGIAAFGNADIILDDTGPGSDLTDATLTATFSSAGVPSVVITVDFA